MSSSMGETLRPRSGRGIELQEALRGKSAKREKDSRRERIEKDVMFARE